MSEKKIQAPTPGSQVLFDAAYLRPGARSLRVPALVHNVIAGARVTLWAIDDSGETLLGPDGGLPVADYGELTSGVPSPACWCWPTGWGRSVSVSREYPVCHVAEHEELNKATQAALRRWPSGEAVPGSLMGGSTTEERNMGRRRVERAKLEQAHALFVEVAEAESGRHRVDEESMARITESLTRHRDACHELLAAAGAYVDDGDGEAETQPLRPAGARDFDQEETFTP